MKEEITIIIVELSEHINKDIKKLYNYTKRHRNTQILILNHNRAKEKEILQQIQDMPRLSYYTPVFRMEYHKSITLLAKKHITTKYLAILPQKDMKGLRYIPKLTNKLKRCDEILTNTGIILSTKEAMATKKPYKQTTTHIPL